MLPVPCLFAEPPSFLIPLEPIPVAEALLLMPPAPPPNVCGVIVVVCGVVVGTAGVLLLALALALGGFPGILRPGAGDGRTLLGFAAPPLRGRETACLGFAVETGLGGSLLWLWLLLSSLLLASSSVVTVAALVVLSPGVVLAVALVL